MRILGLKIAAADHPDYIDINYVEDGNYLHVSHNSLAGQSLEVVIIRDNPDRRTDIWNKVLPLIFGRSKKSASPMVFCTKSDGNEAVDIIEKLFKD